MARTIAKDHDDKRQMIQTTAARLFAAEGYGRVSMASVAKECGISKANIYHYYEGKEALLFDILDTHLQELRDRICGLEFDSDDPAEQLGVIVAELLLSYEGADSKHAVQKSAIAALTEEQQEIVREYQRELVRFVRARVERLVPPEVADDRVKVWQLTMSIFGIVNWHYQWDSHADAATRRAYAKLVTDMIIRGLPAVR